MLHSCHLLIVQSPEWKNLWPKKGLIQLGETDLARGTSKKHY